jgi:hypothetical protein
MTTRMSWSGAAAALALGLLVGPAKAEPPPAEAAPEKKPETQPAEVKKADSPDGQAEAKGDCPPGAFCEDVQVDPPEDVAAQGGDTKKGPVTVVLPPAPPGSDPNAPRTFTYQPDAEGGPGQVIVYEPGAHVPGQTVREAPPGPPEAEQQELHRHRRWGLNLRVQGVILPHFQDEVADDAGMAGLGMSLRYRPRPMFALDLGADFLGGVDANGLERQEVPISLTAMLYANPQHVVQFYLMGGINWSFARVFSDTPQPNLADGTSDEYTYFGGHGGIGLEFRVSQLVGINVDGLAFVRTRTDDDGEGQFPEFYNARTNEASNSSASGLLRAGITFWW